jgi:hypothetical protein
MFHKFTPQPMHDAASEGPTALQRFDIWRDAVLGKLTPVPSSLPDQLLPGYDLGGLGAVLKSHMLATLREAPHMTAEQRTIAMEAALRMAPAVLQADQANAEHDASKREDPNRFGRGFYKAACSLVQRHCSDPAFNAAGLLARLVVPAFFIAQRKRGRHDLVRPTGKRPAHDRNG